jgi:hypothetical protein
MGGLTDRSDLSDGSNVSDRSVAGQRSSVMSTPAEHGRLRATNTTHGKLVWKQRLIVSIRRDVWAVASQRP